MSPLVFSTFADTVERQLGDHALSAALEIGAGGWILLSIPAFAQAHRVALNLRFNKLTDPLEQTERVIGNSNAMDFPDETFDCVMSCSAIEHDKYFWKSVAETRRVLENGGLSIVGAPVHMPLPTDKDYTTLTYARHGLAYNADFYRFSEQAVREVFFEGYSEVTDEIIVRREPNPYIVAAARK
ncbi:MAG: methyltransferase domain-containing protein [Rhodocyclaceae bacterium]|jgi:SAM-dependent methyltransferase|nr:methyltransferase domain-containing protein [Rhodocyclaceae bacterium]MCA3137635.1 methyltransferase domain-containing protein [Rhodocyclaceae bacterium]